MELAQKKYGKAKWASLMEPAIGLASKGYVLSGALSEMLKESKSLAKDPESKRIFQKDGKYFDMGDRITQPELAKVLERIAKEGSKGFYEGDIARNSRIRWPMAASSLPRT